MPYIGNQPAEQFTSFATQEFSTSATTSYTLDHAVTNENEIALFVNNVRQQPGSGKAYTATGTALTLSAATASTDTMYCVFLGRALQTVTPATNSITAAMVGNDLISGKDALTAIPATTDEFLISDAGTLKRIDAQFFQNTPAFEAILSSNASINHDTQTKVQCNTEIFDTAGAYDNSTNFRFTPQTAGKYFVYSKVRIDTTPGNCEIVVSYIFKNGSSYTYSLIDFDNNDGEGGATINTAVIDMNGSSDYIELYCYGKTASGSGTLSLEGDSSAYPTLFGAYKLIGV